MKAVTSLKPVNDAPSDSTMKDKKEEAVKGDRDDRSRKGDHNDSQHSRLRKNTKAHEGLPEPATNSLTPTQPTQPTQPSPPQHDSLSIHPQHATDENPKDPLNETAEPQQPITIAPNNGADAVLSSPSLENLTSNTEDGEDFQLDEETRERLMVQLAEDQRHATELTRKWDQENRRRDEVGQSPPKSDLEEVLDLKRGREEAEAEEKVKEKEEDKEETVADAEAEVDMVVEGFKTGVGGDAQFDSLDHLDQQSRPALLALLNAEGAGEGGENKLSQVKDGSSPEKSDDVKLPTPESPLKTENPENATGIEVDWRVGYEAETGLGIVVLSSGDAGRKEPRKDDDSLQVSESDRKPILPRPTGEVSEKTIDALSDVAKGSGDATVLKGEELIEARLGNLTLGEGATAKATEPRQDVDATDSAKDAGKTTILKGDELIAARLGDLAPAKASTETATKSDQTSDTAATDVSHPVPAKPEEQPAASLAPRSTIDAADTATFSQLRLSPKNLALLADTSVEAHATLQAENMIAEAPPPLVGESRLERDAEVKTKAIPPPPTSPASSSLRTLLSRLGMGGKGSSSAGEDRGKAASSDVETDTTPQLRGGRSPSAPHDQPAIPKAKVKESKSAAPISLSTITPSHPTTSTQPHTIQNLPTSLSPSPPHSTTTSPTLASSHLTSTSSPTSAPSDAQTHEAALVALTAVISSTGHQLTSPLTTRAALLHANNQSLSTQESQLLTTVAGLAKDSEKLAENVRRGRKGLEDVGELGGWYRGLDQALRAVEDTLDAVGEGEGGRCENCGGRAGDAEGGRWCGGCERVWCAGCAGVLFGVEVEGVDEAQAAEGEADADADVKGKGKETAKDEGIFSLEDTASAAPVEPTEPKRSEAWKGSLGRTFKPSSMFEWGGWNRGADSESSSVSSYESDDGWRCPECQLYLDAGGIVDDLAGDDFFVTEQERDDEVVRLMGGAVNAPPPMVGGGGGGKGKERERESDGEGGSKYDAAYWSRLEMLGNSALRDAGGTLPEEEKDVDVDVDGKGKGRA